MTATADSSLGARLVVSAIAIGTLLFLPYSGNFLRGTYIMLMMGLVCIGLILVPKVLNARRATHSSLVAKRDLTWGVKLLLTLLAFKCGSDFVQRWNNLDQRVAIFGTAFDVLTLVGFAAIVRMFHRHELPEMLLAILLGIGIYVAVNVGASRMGMLQAGSEMAGVSGTVRASVPFGPTLNNFGSISSALMGFGLIGLQFFGLRRNWLATISCIASLAIGIAGAMVVQIRSSMFILLLIIGWNLLGRFHWGRWYPNGVLMVGLLLPVAVVSGYLDAMITAITPDFVNDLLVRRDGDLHDFNGRLYVWILGLETVASGGTGFFGQGIIERDSRDALNEQFDWDVEAATMHNGILDVFAVYGPFVAVALFVVLFHLGSQWGTSSTGKSFTGNATWMLSGFLITIVGCGWVESFFTSTLFWGLLIAVATGLGGLRKAQSDVLIGDESQAI